MKIIRNSVISYKAPEDTNVMWLIPQVNGTFKLKLFGANGWENLNVDVKCPTKIKTIELNKNKENIIIGGKCTFDDESTVNIQIKEV